MDNNIPEEMKIYPQDRAFCEKMGRRLRDFRIAHGLSLDEIAKIAGTTAEYMEQYETAKLQIPVYHYLPLVEYFDYPTELALTTVLSE